MKLNFKYNRKAFTLIELLIVIAIIGILFVVLVSKVDFATDKAKITGVQTDFRSFQVAFETVSRENSGFNTLGWDTGDNAGSIAKDGPITINGVDYTYANAEKDAGDRKRNSYDVGDLNLNGKCDTDETFTGRKIYTETWTSIYTLDNPGNVDDKSAYIDLENAINKNLDPKLHVTINPADKTFNMKNGYQDPWDTEYHGFYLTNAKTDGKDRGAIVMYSDGPNKVFGSEQSIANGIVNIGVKNGAIQGQDDLSIATCYTYCNGHGEIKTSTFGFSNNQQIQVGGNNGGSTITPSEPETEPLSHLFNKMFIHEGDVFGGGIPLGVEFRPNNELEFYMSTREEVDGFSIFTCIPISLVFTEKNPDPNANQPFTYYVNDNIITAYVPSINTGSVTNLIEIQATYDKTTEQIIILSAVASDPNDMELTETLTSQPWNMYSKTLNLSYNTPYYSIADTSKYIIVNEDGTIINENGELIFEATYKSAFIWTDISFPNTNGKCLLSTTSPNAIAIMNSGSIERYIYSTTP